MPVDRHLLQVLCCPITHQPVRPLRRDELRTLNDRLEAGELLYQDDSPVAGPIREGLITENGERIYLVEDDIPVMLEERCISARAAGLKH